MVTWVTLGVGNGLKKNVFKFSGMTWIRLFFFEVHFQSKKPADFKTCISSSQLWVASLIECSPYKNHPLSQTLVNSCNVLIAKCGAQFTENVTVLHAFFYIYVGISAKQYFFKRRQVCQYIFSYQHLSRRTRH